MKSFNKPPRRRRAWSVAALLSAAALFLSACGSAVDAAGSVEVDETIVEAATASADTVRLGYFPNVTHAPALIGLANGYFADELGDVPLETQAFNAGPSVIEAMNAGAIDVSFIGPNPAINNFVRTNGEALRIVAGTTSGGAQFVVRDGINGPEDLVGTTIATPQLGNTQDVAARWWLLNQGLDSATGQGGDVSVTPTDNPTALTLFQGGRLDGAWVPEPWASRLVLEGDGHVLVDERDEWPDGQFVTVHLIVRTEFLAQHPDEVEAIIRGLVSAQDFIADDPETAKDLVQHQIEVETGNLLPMPTIDRAFDYTEFTFDPIASSLQGSLDHAVAVDQSPEASLDGIYDLRILNRILAADGRPTVSAAGLGQE